MKVTCTVMILIWISLVAADGFITKAIATHSIPDVSHEKAYTVVREEQFDALGRTKREWCIISDAATPDQRAHTAIKAAIDLQLKTHSDYVIVWLEPTPELIRKGYSLACAQYAPDGKGKAGYQDWAWKVQTSDTQLSVQDINIAKAWEKYRDKFQATGQTDESKLAAHISRELGIPISKIHLPFISLYSYPVK